MKPVRAHAERRAHRVYALVRTPSRSVLALVHVVTSVPISGQLGTWQTAARTFVTAPSVGARSLAWAVPVAQQAFVDVCEHRGEQINNINVEFLTAQTIILLYILENIMESGYYFFQYFLSSNSHSFRRAILIIS